MILSRAHCLTPVHIRFLAVTPHTRFCNAGLRTHARCNSNSDCLSRQVSGPALTKASTSDLLQRSLTTIRNAAAHIQALFAADHTRSGGSECCNVTECGMLHPGLLLALPCVCQPYPNEQVADLARTHRCKTPCSTTLPTQ